MPPREPQPPTPSEEATVRAVLSSFLGPPVEAEVLGLLSGGYVNRNYLIRSGPDRFVLRRHDYNPDAEVIRYEHGLLQFLPDRVHLAVVPKPLLSMEGSSIVSFGGHRYALFPFVIGGRFDGSSPALLREAGRTLAAYHNAAREYLPVPRQRPTFGTVAHLGWAARNALGVEDLWRRVSMLPVRDRREQVVHDSLGFLHDEWQIVRATLTQAAYGHLPQLVIHNDLGPHNILCENGAVTALLDFDLVCWDARVYELAASLVWFAEDESVSPPYSVLPGDRTWALNAGRAKVVFDAYSAAVESPLTRDEIELLPIFTRAFGLWLAVWYLNLRAGGEEWYPEEAAGLMPALRWLRENAVAFVDSFVTHP